MSDALRQDTTDKIGSAVKPDSQKSTLESATDSLKSGADSVGKQAQPDSEKGAFQKASDSVGSAGSDASNQGQGILGQAQEGVTNAANAAGDALGLNKK